MNKFKSHFKFTKQEQSGIFFLLLIIIALQIIFYIVKSNSSISTKDNFILDIETQAIIDSLKKVVKKNDSTQSYPFNPNFITDFKGYTLGMSPDEIDRLHAYRAQNKFVNSSKEFQKITLVTDSLLNAISPFFKFPEWSQKGKTQFPIETEQRFEGTDKYNPYGTEQNHGIKIKDLNTATTEDLKAINGIGEILSVRIVKFRERLGGFLIEDQLNDVYGLEPEVTQRVLERFKIINKPTIERININTASANQISQLIYLKYSIAEKIVEYREINGTISSFDELTKIEDFPIDKIHRIELYLTL